jgi:hypothetical protein
MKVRINGQEIDNVYTLEIVNHEVSNAKAIAVTIALILMGWWLL